MCHGLAAGAVNYRPQPEDSGVGRGGATGAPVPPLLMESLQIQAKLYRSTYLLKLVAYQLHIKHVHEAQQHSSRL